MVAGSGLLQFGRSGTQHTRFESAIAHPFISALVGATLAACRCVCAKSRRDLLAGTSASGLHGSTVLAPALTLLLSALSLCTMDLTPQLLVDALVGVLHFLDVTHSPIYLSYFMTSLPGHSHKTRALAAFTTCAGSLRLTSGFSYAHYWFICA